MSSKAEPRDVVMKQYDAIVKESHSIFYNVLVALVGKSLNAYEIMERIESDTGQNISTASLYRYLRQMLDNDLIEITDVDIEKKDPRQRYFRLTELGQEVGIDYRRHFARQAALVDDDFSKRSSDPTTTPAFAFK